MLKNYKTLFSLVLLLAGLLSGSNLLAQQLAQINYQGVARKADGSPVMDQSIKLRLTIHDGSATGTSVYSETRQLTTNKFGLFTTVIGSGGAISQSGTVAAVNWSTGNKYLQVELDPQGGNSFVNMGTSQLQSVPYAIYAGSAAPEGVAGGDLSGSYPSPAVSKLQGKDVSNAAPNMGQVLKWSCTAWIPSDEEGAVGTLTANSPITASTVGRNSAISITKADATTDGYLSKSDWLIFNGKASITYVDEAIALNSNALATEKVRATAAEAKKEDVANKSTDMVTDAASDAKYPTVKSVKSYVDANTSTGSAALTTEIDRAKAAETTMTTSLAAEVIRATTAEATLTTTAESNATAIAAETVRAKAAETTLSTTTETNATAITSLSTGTQTALGTKVNIADTTAMLLPYAKQLSIQTALAAKLNSADTTAMLSTYAKQAATQTAINTKLNIADTTAMLSPYAKQAIVNLKLTATDTTAMLSPYAKSASTLTAINAKLSIADTTAMLSPYAKSAVTLMAVNAKLNIADTTAMLLPYAKSASTLTAINTKLNISDTTVMLSPYAKSAATLTAINAKLNIADTTAMLSPYAKNAATLTAINTKLSIADTTTMLSTYAKQAIVNLKLTATDTTAMLSPYAKQAIVNLKLTATDTTAMLLPYINIADTAAMLSPYAKASAFVNLTTAQTIAGAKTFSTDISVNGISVGKGAGSIDQNTAFGVDALNANTSGEANTAFGAEALKLNTTGFLNTAIGGKALSANTEGARNTAIGANALTTNNGNDNTSTGYVALSNNTSGSYNTGFGSEALRFNTIGQNNTAVGGYSLTDNQIGGENTAVGHSSLIRNTSGGGNTAIGTNSLSALVSGNYNTALGVQSLQNSNSASSNNTAIGAAAIDGNTTGNNNAVLGAFAGRYISDDATSNTKIDNSVLIGAETKPKASSETNQIVIGYQAIGNGSNTVQLGNDEITAVNTSGKLTTGQVTYPNTKGVAGQVLTTDANGVASWSAASANPTFTTDISVNGISFGMGAGSGISNLVIGNGAFTRNTSGTNNVTIGRQAATNSTEASNNTIVGNAAVYYNELSGHITAFGSGALHAEKGEGNTAIGSETGRRGGIQSDLTNSTFLGRSATAGAGPIDNATALGNGAIVNVSNKIQLGNTSVTAVNTSGKLTTGQVTYPNTKGTVGQMLTTDADGVASWTTGAAIREIADEFTATASQESFTLSQAPSLNSKVKMYINGIRISNTAYSISVKALTYTAANNGSYVLSAGDRIQFDYYY